MLELLGFGKDISKVRNQLLENLEVIKDPNFVDAILEKFKDRLKEREDLLEQLMEDEVLFPIQMIIGAFFTAIFGAMGYNFLKRIAQQPFLISRVHCLAVEVLYNLENDDNGEEIGFLIKLMQRKHHFFLSEAVQLLKEKVEDWIEIPDGYYQIKGRLDLVQLRRFFAFLHIENNCSLDDKPFLLKEEVEELLKDRLSYPLKEPEVKPFSLRLNSYKSLSIVYYAFYQLYIRHRPVICGKDYKTHFAYFLKHHFDNFDIPIESIRSSIRSARPKRMRKGFDLEDYFDG